MESILKKKKNTETARVPFELTKIVAHIRWRNCAPTLRLKKSKSEIPNIL